MIHETHIGFFAHVPGEVYPRGPFRSREQAERTLANVATRRERAAAPSPRQPVPKSDPIEPRAVKRMPPSSRTKRRKQAIDARHVQKVAKRRAKLARVKRADAGAMAGEATAENSPSAQGDTVA